MKYIQKEIHFRTDISQVPLSIIHDNPKEFGPLHIKLCKGIDFTDKNQLPIVTRVVESIPDRMSSFHRLKNVHANRLKGSCVHFFVDDKKIEPLWTKPQFYAKVLSRFDFVISTDFSVYMDMLRIQKWWNDFRNKLLAAYFQRFGVRIVPAPSWADMEDIERYAEGWPRESLIAINSTGVGHDKRSIHNWLDGYYAMLDILKPKHILRYGRMMEGEFHDISTFYDNNNQKGAYYGRKRILL